jgi:SAM-dependent methyltransferase
VRAARGWLRRKWNQRRTQAEIWHSSLPRELDYWDAWIKERGGSRKLQRISDSFQWRIDPASELQPPLREVVDRCEGPAVSILDVGAGPLTSVGKVHPEKELRLVAVDPLASEYNRLLERAGIEPPVRTVPGEAEKLLERYRRESFDIAHADNALDHSADPLEAIDNMLAVVKRGGYVVLRHLVNAGERNFYLGLHQWNFEVADEELILWNPRARHNLSRRLSPQANVVCRDEGKRIVCVIAKRSGAPGG